MRVKKNSGELVKYNAGSLKQSLSRSGASGKEVETVLAQMESKVYNGISTRELYELAFSFLKVVRNTYAARYSLKKALRDLGPDGFYFEKWVCRIFQEDGYEAVTGQTIQGAAVTHEIDVLANKGNQLLAIECKFRNDVDAKISVTTPMYFMSRVKDISHIDYNYFGKRMQIDQGWLITNAYLTKDSISFGEHYKMNLLAWDYPKKDSLKLRIDNNGEYPITCLTTLSTDEKSKLLKSGCILVKDILRSDQFFENLAIDEAKKKQIQLEAKELINSPIEHY